MLPYSFPTKNGPFTESPFRGEFSGGSQFLDLTLWHVITYYEKILKFSKRIPFQCPPLLGGSGKFGFPTPYFPSTCNTSPLIP
jgi:hypothetical protein